MIGFVIDFSMQQEINFGKLVVLWGSEYRTSPDIHVECTGLQILYANRTFSLILV